MSSIYIQEPPTSGKVLLKTSVGDIDVELWSRECPKACRNFIQLCMEGYYDNTIFHRLVKGFIVQGGDPDGDGHGGESIFGEPFKDEFHSRLRYTRRGLVGMANSGKNDNGSQFFFTFAATPELQNQNTLFGKVTGDTIFNMLKLEEGMVDHNERPVYPHKIIKTVILNNPFDDIVPRKSKKKSKDDEGSSSKRMKDKKGVKNYGLLSFGEEAEEDEMEATEYVQKSGNKSKSTHDVLDDPKLSKEEVKIERQRSKTPESEILAKEREEAEIKKRQEMVREKLSKKKVEIVKKASDEESDEDTLDLMDRERMEERQKKAEEIRKEIAKLKKGYASEKKAAVAAVAEEEKKKEKHNKIIEDYLQEKAVYVEKVKKLPKKGASREDHTLALLAKFKAKLNSARSTNDDDDEDDKVEEKPSSSNSENVDIDQEIQSDNWLAHKLHFESEIPVLAKDASTKGDDWYDVYDPRNPMNKRKRNETNNDKNAKSKRSDR